MKNSSWPADEASAQALAAFQPQPPDLIFPDWSGCDRRAPAMTVDEMRALSEELMKHFKMKPLPNEWQDRCHAEFVL